MAREEIFITDIADVHLEGDVVRAEFRSGRKRIVLRGSLHMLLKSLEMGRRAVAERPSAKVVSLPGH